MKAAIIGLRKNNLAVILFGMREFEAESFGNIFLHDDIKDFDRKSSRRVDLTVGKSNNVIGHIIEQLCGAYQISIDDIAVILS